MLFYKTPKVWEYFFSSAVWRVKTQERCLFLTFDDGPTSRTLEMLDTLDRFDAKATFFCVGNNVKEYPAVFEEIIHRGHSVGNHGATHAHGWKRNTTSYMNDVSAAAQLIPSKLFRPPYGKMRWLQYRKLKKTYKIVMWSHLAYDFKPDADSSKFYKSLFSNFKGGEIVVLHDNLKYFDKSLQMLSEILAWAKREGIRCVKL
jgi:peptidoglycan/xylan/chitin deacetylase (PgdA/CDA1 family)